MQLGHVCKAIGGVARAADYYRKFIIDKCPGYFLHIGLIKRIMSDSIFIDAKRDPRDIAISAYGQLFNVRNEFALSFDEEIAALLDFCGLEQEAGCIEFYEHERAATTPSAAQVSQPMYTSSACQ